MLVVFLQKGWQKTQAFFFLKKKAKRSYLIVVVVNSIVAAQKLAAARLISKLKEACSVNESLSWNWCGLTFLCLVFSSFLHKNTSNLHSQTFSCSLGVSRFVPGVNLLEIEGATSMQQHVGNLNLAYNISLGSSLTTFGLENRLSSSLRQFQVHLFFILVPLV